MTSQRVRFLLAAALVLACSVAGADEPANPVVAEAVPLPEDELQQITLGMLQRYPELAGSPGVKSAGAYLRPDATGSATVIYYPHTERRGIKEAFQFHCRRTAPSTSWSCYEYSIRRYLQLASQEFEVRVLADISSDAAFALIEGSRRDLHAGASDVAELPTTAIIVTSHHEEPDQYFVSWGTPEGYSTLTMLAKLAADGDPKDPDSWRATIFEPAQHDQR